MSKKQYVVALSTTEVEYMAATHASKEVAWLQRLYLSMGLVQEAIRIYCDSQSAIFLAKNPAYHSKTKHIDVQYHFVMDMIEDKKVLLVKVDTLKNTADALKKSNSYVGNFCTGLNPTIPHPRIIFVLVMDSLVLPNMTLGIPVWYIDPPASILPGQPRPYHALTQDQLVPMTVATALVPSQHQQEPTPVAKASTHGGKAKRKDSKDKAPQPPPALRPQS
eukprot:PITA_06498